MPIISEIFNHVIGGITNKQNTPAAYLQTKDTAAIEAITAISAAAAYDEAALTNLDGVVANTEGAFIDVAGKKRITFHIISVGATDATVKIQSTLDGTNWVTIETFVLAAAGISESITSDVAYIGMRSIVESWVSGTITTKYVRS